MFKIVCIRSAALISLSALALSARQASAAQNMPAQTCDISDPNSTIESCDSLINGYKQILTVKELDIRSKDVSDPYRSKEMHEYQALKNKLDKAISNKAKIQSEIGMPKLAPKSSFRWPSANGARVNPFDGASAISDSKNWSGQGAAIQTTQGFGHIYRVTGTFVVPTAQIPPGSRCTGSGYMQFRTSAWVGIGGDTKYIVFACFNNSYKITPEIFAL